MKTQPSFFSTAITATVQLEDMDPTVIFGKNNVLFPDSEVLERIRFGMTKVPMNLRGYMVLVWNESSEGTAEFRLRLDPLAFLSQTRTALGLLIAGQMHATSD